ncbi:MAG: hypothetical protein NT027_00490, partial [Proteobacteria bacterium]|nr:hypothetical protein [Pseudomonadota bacterium]
RKDLLIEKVKYNENLFDIGYTKEGRDWVIITKLKPNLPIGFIKETIYVKTNSIDLPELPIPVRASVKGKITSFPAYLEFGSIVKSSSSNRTLNFTSNSNFDILSHKIELMVNGASIDNPDKTVNLAISPMPNHSKKLSLELMNTGQFQGSVHGKIIFETSNPLHKNLAVDFYSFFR